MLTHLHSSHKKINISIGYLRGDLKKKKETSSQSVNLSKSTIWCVIHQDQYGS